ncbi:hypothetical protein GH714_017837 [Hevea brasiliensis]|uniref:Retrotransposon Copia-like N-terminal domain-containing protein n=1 Tax=Hevea brasiliensis TaxID=3981 RepID=A0A6A6KR42_HEVBR|nr:hypothetical protein GH714_017837 [Hevea brasiliensis]
MESLLYKPQQDMKRLEKFNGMNYKCWSMKIMYQLTATKVLYVLNTPYPQDGTSEGQLSEAQQKWVEDDFVCHSMILNAISNALFNVFHKCYPAYELWATIELRLGHIGSNAMHCMISHNYIPKFSHVYTTKLEKDLPNELESSIQIKDVGSNSLSKPMINPSSSTIVKTFTSETTELRRSKRCKIEKDLGPGIDANWASDRRSSKSTSGWLFTIGGAIVSWSSKKQSCVALPSMESKFIAMSLASRDFYGLRDL